MLSEPSSGLPRRRIVNCVQPRSKLTILRSLKAKTHDYLRHRKAHARTTDKNVHFSLPRPRKTVCFDRQRPKTTVFRIAHLRVRIMALQGGGHGPPGRRGSRHRSGKTTQNWEAQRRSGERSPGARVAAPRARVVTPRATWISASRRENHPELGGAAPGEGRGPYQLDNQCAVAEGRAQSERRGARAKGATPERGAQLQSEDRAQGERAAPERGRNAIVGCVTDCGRRGAASRRVRPA